MSIPLHEINIGSNLISGPITMAIVIKYLMNEVEMLLGNNLAGRKMMTLFPTKPRKPIRKKSVNKKIRTANAVQAQ